MTFLLPSTSSWVRGSAPVAVLLITLNEAHNIEPLLQNLTGWAQEVFLVDSYSRDNTVDIALRFGIYVVQRRFRDFGDQWNFALRELPISAPWTMKMDPDERLSNNLKSNLIKTISLSRCQSISIERRLWFMSKPLPVRQKIIRLWRTGTATFSNTLVNEHPIVQGTPLAVKGDLDHFDSPCLEHWIHKQNLYSTAEAAASLSKLPLADSPRLFGSNFQRRMLLKFYFIKIPFRYFMIFIYYFLVIGSFRSGLVGFRWSRLRADIMRWQYYKYVEMTLNQSLPPKLLYGPGSPDPRVFDYDSTD